MRIFHNSIIKGFLSAALLMPVSVLAQTNPLFSVLAKSTFKSCTVNDGNENYTLNTAEENNWLLTTDEEPYCVDSLVLQMSNNYSYGLTQDFALDYYITQIKIDCGSVKNALVTVSNEEGAQLASTQLLPFQTTTIDLPTSGDNSTMAVHLDFSCIEQAEGNQPEQSGSAAEGGSIVVKSITMTFNQEYYNIVVRGDETHDDVTVTDANRANILSENEPSVSFDGDHTLILNNADLSAYTLDCTYGGDIDIYFTGDNTIKAINGGYGTLTFITDTNKPGTLTLGNQDDATANTVISGFDGVMLTKGLSVLTPAEAAFNEECYSNEGWKLPSSGQAAATFITYAEIGARIQPILDEETEPDEENPQAEEVTFTTTDIEETTDLTNITINNVVITLSDNDGYDEVEGSADQVAIVLNTAVEEATVIDVADKVAKGELEPGTDEYAAAFTGLTFMVPAGTGVIKLKMEITDGYALNVKVGKTAPITFTQSTSNEDEAMVPYVCAQPEYVYIYNATPEAATARKKVRSQAVYRERKTGGHIKLTSFLVDPEGVLAQNKPEAQRVVSALEYGSDAIMFTGNKIRVDDGNVNTLTDGFFKQNYAAALPHLRCINLTGTAITGVEVSRSRGAFDEVPADAIIYMPAGNTAAEGEANIIIGGVCNNLQIQKDNENYEGMEMDFSAQAVTFGREFNEDQTSTVFLPFGIDKGTAAALGRFYTFNTIDANGNATLNEVTTGTEAHTPYIYIKNHDGNMTVNNVKVKGGTPLEYKHGELVGTYEAKTFNAADLEGKYYYGYAATADAENGIEAGEFVRIGEGAFIKPFRAYLELEGDHGSRIAIDWGNGTVTGIKTKPQADDAGQQQGIYDLQGRKVNTELKVGIYIKDGKKIVIR